MKKQKPTPGSTISIWVTKYALTKGVFQTDARLGGEGQYAYYSPAGGGLGLGYSVQVRLGTEAFEDHGEAIVNAVQRARRKIATSQKAIDKANAAITRWEESL